MIENPNLIFVLGGARSGKSAYAEGLLAAHPSPWIYIATAEIFDDEMRLRVDAHRARRDAQWRTIVTGILLLISVATPVAIDVVKRRKASGAIKKG